MCPEVAELLKDKSVDTTVFTLLRKMKPMRQIEAVELMSAMNNYTARYAHALLAATRQDDLAQPERPKKVRGLTAEQMARMASLLRGSRCPRIKHSPAGDRVVESGFLRQDKLSRLRGLCANLLSSSSQSVSAVNPGAACEKPRTLATV